MCGGPLYNICHWVYCMATNVSCSIFIYWQKSQRGRILNAYLLYDMQPNISQRIKTLLNTYVRRKIYWMELSSYNYDGRKPRKQSSFQLFIMEFEHFGYLSNDFRSKRIFSWILWVQWKCQSFSPSLKYHHQKVFIFSKIFFKEFFFVCMS